MIGFFKKIGKGLGYIFFVPLYLALICVIGAVGIVLLFFLFVKALYLFFTGRSMHDDLPEDVKAKEILKRSNPNYVEPSLKQEEKIPFSSLYIKEETQPEPVKEQTIEEVAFQDDLVKDIQKEEEEIIQPFEQPKTENPSFESNEKPEEKEEELERYTPLTNKENQSTFFSDISIDEEDDR